MEGGKHVGDVIMVYPAINRHTLRPSSAEGIAVSLSRLAESLSAHGACPSARTERVPQRALSESLSARCLLPLVNLNENDFFYITFSLPANFWFLCKDNMTKKAFFFNEFCSPSFFGFKIGCEKLFFCKP